MTPASAGQLFLQIETPSPPCPEGMTGFSGRASMAGAEVRFWSCAGEDLSVCHSKIWKKDGQMMSEVRVGPGGTQVWLGGVEVRPDNSEEEAGRVKSVLAGPETEIVRGLYPAMKRIGLDPSAPAFVCLQSHFQAYENTTKP